MQEDDPEQEKPGWSYNSEAGDTAAPAETPGVSWTASEYIAHPHGPGWYMGLIAGTAILTAVLYFLSKSIFSAGVAPVLGVIVGIFASRPPRQVDYELDQKGIRIAGRLYPYSSFKSFSILDEGGIPSISLTPLKRFMPPISAYFEPEQAPNITAALGDHLPFEQRRPDYVERLTHRLRF